MILTDKQKDLFLILLIDDNQKFSLAFDSLFQVRLRLMITLQG